MIQIANSDMMTFTHMVAFTLPVALVMQWAQNSKRSIRFLWVRQVKAVFSQVIIFSWCLIRYTFTVPYHSSATESKHRVTRNVGKSDSNLGHSGRSSLVSRYRVGQKRLVTYPNLSKVSMHFPNVDTRCRYTRGGLRSRGAHGGHSWWGPRSRELGGSASQTPRSIRVP